MIQLFNSDCLDVLRTLPECSVDSVITDPPYGLSDHKPADVTACLSAWLAGEEYRPKKKGFMGRSWDAWVPGPEVWREVFRVLKPGGHVVAFAGSRTHDLMSMALRLAGFENRDTVMWVYGSGFPKSMDVSKAIDKANGRHERDLVPFGDYVREMREAKGWTLRQLDEAMGTNTAASWWEGRKAGVQPPGLEQYRKLKSILSMDSRFDELIEWLEAEREVVGKKAGLDGSGFGNVGHGLKSGLIDITAPATEAARQWAGWGTALKPAFEPALLFRKPLVGTVAENVLAHGTGALNIDGCRVEGESTRRTNTAEMGYHGGNLASEYQTGSDAGRWPANLIHDGSDEVVALFPDSAGSGGSVPNVKVTGYGDGIGTGKSEYFGGERKKHEAGSGSAARFFYTAKVSKKERNEGLLDGVANIHPTLKPVSLMAYLCRLVTPPGGIVLDPFMGSGSTGKAAIREGFRFIGIEREESYFAIAKSRIGFEEKSVESTSKASSDKRNLELFA